MFVNEWRMKCIHSSNALFILLPSCCRVSGVAAHLQNKSCTTAPSADCMSVFRVFICFVSFFFFFTFFAESCWKNLHRCNVLKFKDQLNYKTVYWNLVCNKSTIIVNERNYNWIYFTWIQPFKVCASLSVVWNCGTTECTKLCMNMSELKCNYKLTIGRRYTTGLVTFHLTLFGRDFKKCPFINVVAVLHFCWKILCVLWCTHYTTMLAGLNIISFASLDSFPVV